MNVFYFLNFLAKKPILKQTVSKVIEEEKLLTPTGYAPIRNQQKCDYDWLEPMDGLFHRNEDW